MKPFWKIFWLTLSIVLGITVIGGIIVSVYLHSAAAFYQTVRLVFTLGSGICGFIALLVVPFELYVEDKKSRRELWR